MRNLWEILTGAPWWFYLLFIYFLIIGFRATQTRTIAIKRVFLFLLFFSLFSIYNLYEKILLGGKAWLIIVWGISLTLGLLLGRKEILSWKISIHREKSQITLPGNISTLVLVLLIFLSNFFWGYAFDLWDYIPTWAYIGDVFTSSLLSGVFIGRALSLLILYGKRRT